jgi:TatD DNase family protein
LDLGFYISFAGVLTFRNADALRAVCAFVPLDRMLVETDAPYMAPVPHRGRRNEPLWVVETAQAIAVIKNLPPEKVFSQLVANTMKAFSRLGKEIVKEDAGAREE